MLPQGKRMKEATLGKAVHGCLKCYAQLNSCSRHPTPHDSSCTSSIMPGFGARAAVGCEPATELIDPMRSFGGGSSFIQAFSNMFVHFPLVPAWLCFRCCLKWSALQNFFEELHWGRVSDGPRRPCRTGDAPRQICARDSSALNGHPSLPDFGILHHNSHTRLPCPHARAMNGMLHERLRVRRTTKSGAGDGGNSDAFRPRFCF
jgi:hypothetical protein